MKNKRLFYLLTLVAILAISELATLVLAYYQIHISILNILNYINGGLVVLICLMLTYFHYIDKKKK